MKETKEVIVFATSMIKALDESLEDGKLSISDIVNFVQVVPEVGRALAGAGDIVDELKNITPDQFKDLEEFVKVNFQLRHKETEVLIEYVISLVISLVMGIKEFRKVK